MLLLPHQTQLRYLNLRDCALTDEGAAVVLRAVAVAVSPTTNSEIADDKEHRGLTFLDLSGEKIDPRAIFFSGETATDRSRPMNSYRKHYFRYFTCAPSPPDLYAPRPLRTVITAPSNSSSLN